MVSTDELKKAFALDGFVAHNGMEIVSVDGDRSVVRADVKDRAINAAGSVHGGMLFSIADFAFAVLANYLHPVTVTQSASISYIASCADTAYITAESREIAVYRHNCVHEVTVYDDKGRVVCVAQMNGFIKEKIAT